MDILHVGFKVDKAALDEHNRRVDGGSSSGWVDPDPSEWDFDQLTIAIEQELIDDGEIVGYESR
jgi:hypothetical protein